MKAATHFANLSYDKWEANRDELYCPLPENPFTTLRKQQDLSHQKMADKIGVSKLSLLRLEQGIYPDPLPSVLYYFVKHEGENELHLTDAYYEFQNLTRSHYHHLFGSDLTIDIESVVHPLFQLRKNGDGEYSDLSVMQVSKFLCVAQSTLQYWESKWRIQKHMPKPFALALQGNGYSASEINLLGYQYIEWRACRKSGVSNGR